MIKEFAVAYGTTPTHMSEILSKEDFNTSIIRKFEGLLKANFSIINSTKSIGSESLNEYCFQYSINSRKSGRPITVGKKDSQPQVLLEVREAEIRSLRQLLESKDEIIESKNEFIYHLISTNK